jgi:outer membrane protein assembly factor BamB
MITRFRTLAVALALVVMAIGGAAAESFTFVHVTDTHITGSTNPVRNLKAIAAELNAMNPKPAFVVVTGDLTEAGLPIQWERYAEILKDFTMPVYNVVGNHEMKWSHLGTFGLHKYLNQEQQYSFDHGGVHFVAMNSAVWLQHHGLIDKSELAWLRNDLEKAGRSTPSVLFYHHCPGFIPNEPELLRTIRPYNVRLILVGHGHRFHTWKRNGLEFLEGVASMNSEGGYRICEVTDTQMRTFTKFVGKPKAADEAVSLTRALNPVSLKRPLFGERIEGPFEIRATVGPGRSCEYAIDGDAKPMTPDANGICTATVNFGGDPGWHTVSVTAKDPDGMGWTDSVPVRINGAEREAWRVQVPGGVERDVRVVDDRLYFGTLGGDAYCLDAPTGNQIWRYSAGSDIVSGVAADGSLACFGTIDGRVIGLDANNGTRRWEFAAGGPVIGSPAISDGRVLVGSGEPAFYAIDAASGKQVWKYPMDRATQVAPVVADGKVLFGAWDKVFYALDVKTGKPAWQTPIGASWYFSTASSDPATSGSRIVANATPYKPADADVYCLDTATGKIAWSRHNPGKSDCGFNSPCVDGDKCYSVDDGGAVYCMSMADGKDLWHASANIMTIGCKPVVSHDSLYINGLHGNVACIGTDDRKLLWSYSTGDGYLFGGEAIWKDLVIVPSCDGTVTAIRQ